MGLQHEIGFVARRANRAQRVLQRVAAIPMLSPFLSRLVTPIDRVLHRFSGGRASASAGLVAFPTIVLETTGAKTGKMRSTPLAAIPVGIDLGLIASNAGSGKIPGWAHNLDANPAATVSYGSKRVAVSARPVQGDEYDEVFAAADRIYAGFAGYRERADYTIPVFILEALEVTDSKGSELP